MAQRTFVLSLSAGVSLNVAAALRTAGWENFMRPDWLTIYNPSATEVVYWNLSDSSTAAPATPTNGLPLLKDAPKADFTYVRIPPAEGLDLNFLWLYAANAASVKVMIIGG